MWEGVGGGEEGVSIVEERLVVGNMGIMVILGFRGGGSLMKKGLLGEERRLVLGGEGWVVSSMRGFGGRMRESCMYFEEDMEVGVGRVGVMGS